jgi:quinohemoprotein ethanol dehydrogenase
MSFNPATRLVYIPASESTFVYGRDTNFRFRPGFWNLGIDLAASTGVGRTGPVRPQGDYSGGTGEAAGSPSSLLAWDPVAKRPAWRVLHEGAIGGGTLTTAGNLVFQGTDTGNLVAYSADRGEKLWEMDVGIGIMAAPSTYSLDGKQYVAVLAGMGGATALYGRNPTNHFKATGRVYAFALDARAAVPPVQGIERQRPEPIANDATAEEVARGAELFGQRCSMCHGVAAQSGGSIADLRYAVPATIDAFERIVRGGAYAGLGMPAFDWLSDTDVAALRGYILSRRAALLAEPQR